MKHFDLEKIKDFIIEKYDWGVPDDWTNYHFKELSKEIQEVTGDRISEETLKRIFGKRKVDTEKYQPQAFSQMVLVKFVESFTKQEPPQKKLSKKMLVTLVFLIIVVLSIVLFRVYFEKPKEYFFTCENPEDYYPFTAIFHYDVSDIKDSVFVRFMANEEAYLPPDKSSINLFYSLGGRYTTYFYTRDKVLDSIKVKVNCRDWQGGYYPNNEPESFVPFFDQGIFKQGDYFYASPEKLDTEGINLKEKYYTSYRYFSNFSKSLDDLTLETRVLNNEKTGSYLCYDIGISLIGENDGMIDFKFTQPKCFRFATLRVSEKYLNGEYDNLNPLSVDMSDWLQIKATTNNGEFMLYLGEELIFTETYKQELGMLAGVIIYFYGTGKIDYLDLKDENQNTFYQYDFSY